MSWYFTVDLIYISLMISDDESLFQVLFDHLYIFSGKRCIQILCSLLYQIIIIFFFAIDFFEFLIVYILNINL